MTLLAPVLEKYFTAHLMHELGASGHTIAAYRDTWRLLLAYMREHTQITPSRLALTDLDSDHIHRFLRYLEEDRHNSIRTRNARLAAIHSFFTYASYRHPDHADQISRILAIPLKRSTRTDITWLTDEQVTALLNAPDRSTRTGRRDHALLQTAITTGLRVAELTALTWGDTHLPGAAGAYLHCHGKGRKDRATPLSTDTAATLTNWRTELDPADPSPVFPTRTGNPMSTDAVAQRLTLHAHTAATDEPSLTRKTITPHVLRHTTAMRMLHDGIDTSVIALWLGHESPETTQIYLHADLTLKENALERVRPLAAPAGRYKPDDALLTFLESL